MDRTSAQEWLDRYVAAWRSYDPAAIGALFADDVAYRYHPYDEPILGRDAVVASWLGEDAQDVASSRDEPGTFDASYAPVAMDGDTMVAQGTTTYRKVPGGPVHQVYDNCFVMRFDDRGRCRKFTEFYVLRPESD
ncbi:nuclear transport factor 2 family protein [Nocardioides endophyticus]